jgi:hypothetical protein
LVTILTAASCATIFSDLSNKSGRDLRPLAGDVQAGLSRPDIFIEMGEWARRRELFFA